MRSARIVFWLSIAGSLIRGALAAAQEPPAINPFGPRRAIREDAIPGFAELSDGTVYPGRVYLTRDARLKIYDAHVQRHREIPLRVVRRLDCTVEKEWMEKEWRFKENANDQKVYTGRSYPARQYVYTITLQDGRTIQGPLSGVVYVQAENGGRPKKFLLYKRQKGAIRTDLKSLVYVRSVQLGDAAYEEGLRRAQQQHQLDQQSGNED